MKNNVLLIYGLPGVGKTTLVKGFIDDGFKKYAQPFAHYFNNGICIFGDYHADTAFLGTDKLSMSVQPQAIDFIAAQPDWHYIIEGDRLFNDKFIAAVAPTILIIEASAEEIKQRRAARGAQQNEQFLSARETKIENIKAKHAHYIMRNGNGAIGNQLRANMLALLFRSAAPLAQFCPPTNQQEDLFA